ncbi:hypothetical protein ICN38_02950 [Polynucleobacter sp. AP-Melu-500A-A1]|nr:hypothetical protein [Polynucleobacter sp. AP-Melu-500A-A1]
MAFLVIAGPRFLDPTNVAWLVGGDPLQHYLGWAFYRNSPWTWPVGLNPLYGMEFSNSIVFTDSIPLLAIPFKAISQFLPYPFQYLGIWVLLCFVLQAYFAFRLIGLITTSIAIQCLGSIFFLFSPPLIFRLSLHESLMGHFIILAALYLNLKPITESTEAKKKYLHSLAWIILLSIAVSTHFYLAVMVLALWFADLCNRVFVKKSSSYKEALLENALLISVAGFIAWQAGYFAIEGASGATRGFGDFRTNLLALFNSRGWSYWLRPIPLQDVVEAANGEGFQYLGAGSLLLLLSTIFAVIKGGFNLSHSLGRAWKSYPFLISTLIVLALISFSNHIGFGPWNLRMPLPEFIIGLLSIVRSSSRLFWPIYYTILLAILYVLIRSYSVKNVLILLGIAATIQVVDTSAGWLLIREKVSLSTSDQFKTALQDPFWKNAGKHYKNLVTTGGQENWEQFGIYASENQMASNIAYLARADLNKTLQSFSAVNQQLHQGPINRETLYVFQDWKNSPDQIKYDPQKDLLARIDRVNLLAPGWKACTSCIQVPQELELNQLAPILKLGQVVDFTKSGNGRANFMLGGWGFAEDWGTWAIDGQAKVILPMPEGGPSRLIIKANAFLSKNHPEQVVDIAINGIRLADQMVLKNAKDNLIEVKLPKGLKTPGEPLVIEFRSLDAISPQAVGFGPDERKLGIGIVAIQFSR